MRSGEQCQRFQLWSAIGSALDVGLWSFLIDVGPNVTICPRSEAITQSSFSSSYITDAMKGGSRHTISSMEIIRNVFKLIDDVDWIHQSPIWQVPGHARYTRRC